MKYDSERKNSPLFNFRIANYLIHFTQFFFFIERDARWGVNYRWRKVFGG